MERLRGNGVSSPQAQSTQSDFQINPEIVELYKMYSMSQNPSALMDQMTQRIPIIGQLKSGGNMKDRFYSMCKEKGIEPDSILSQLKR